MILFWSIAALMIVAALGFLLPSLWRAPKAPPVDRPALNLALFKDKLAELEGDLRLGTLSAEQFEQGRRDLERGLLEDIPEPATNSAVRPAPRRGRWLVPVIGILLPAGAVGLYLLLGAQPSAINTAAAPPTETPGMPSPHPGMAANGAMSGADAKALSIDVAAERLAQRLKDAPNDAEGWLLLARSHQFLKRYAEADAAFGKAIALGRNDAQILAAQAEMRALAANPPAPAATEAEPAAASPADEAEVQVGQLVQHLKEHPEDAASWGTLGHAYQSQQRFLDAADAYDKATANIKNDARLWADYADVLGAANGRHLAGRPQELIEKALAVDPNQPKALWLAATAALERGDKVGAVKYWQQLQKQLPPDSQDAKIITANIAEASGKPAADGTAAAPDTATVPPRGAVHVRGKVSIAPELAKDISGEDALFIFAKAANGPPMPLAVLRKQARELPVEFLLDDSMAMMPAARLSNFHEVIVGARVSRSGSALPASGDLEGLSDVITVGGDTVINIVINHRI